MMPVVGCRRDPPTTARLDVAMLRILEWHGALLNFAAAANTRSGAKRIHTVRARGGNLKFRALRLDSGNFSWGSEGAQASATRYTLSRC